MQKPIIKKMKSVVVLFAGNPGDFQFSKVFNFGSTEISAVDSSIKWASSVSSAGKIFVISSKENESMVSDSLKEFSSKEYSVITKPDASLWTTTELLEKLSECAQEAESDYVVYANAAFPFLNIPFTEKLIQTHTEYKAEYTFADGYPKGFAPEVIDAGTLNILKELSKTVSQEAGKHPVSQESIFDVIKGDINSFEIETEIPDHDFRLLRMNFVCDNKINFLSSLALLNKLKEENKINLLTDCKSIGDENVMAISHIASKSAEVLRTVPAFYNVQIEGSCGHTCAFCPYPEAFEKKYGEKVMGSKKCMEPEKFAQLAEKMSVFSDTAFVSLSLWGEAVLNKNLPLYVKEILSHDGLSCLIECSGFSLETVIDSGVFDKLMDIVRNAGPRKSGSEKIIFIVSLDAHSGELYSKLHGGNFDGAIQAVKKLHDMFNNNDCAVYTQFLRMEENEEELEGFYRYWKEKESPTEGKFIIQKYDHFLKTLPEVKTADLSPLNREACWHLRRDMEILFDGNVPVCREVMLDEIIGNVFEDELPEIWNRKNQLMQDHLDNNFNEKCGKCDEYYTFNF